MDGPGESGGTSSPSHQRDRPAGRQRKRLQSTGHGPGTHNHAGAGAEELSGAAQTSASVELSAAGGPAAAAAQGPCASVTAAVQDQGTSDTERQKKNAPRPQWVKRIIVRHLRQLSPRTDKATRTICAYLGKPLEKQIDDVQISMLMQRVLGSELPQACRLPTTEELGVGNAEDGAAIYMAKLLSACSGTHVSPEQYKKCVVKQGRKWVVAEREFTALCITPWTWTLPFKVSEESDTSVTIANVKAALKTEAQAGATSAVAGQQALQQASVMPQAELHVTNMVALQQLMATQAMTAGAAASAATSAAIVASQAAAQAVAVASTAAYQGATNMADLNDVVPGGAAANTLEATHTGPVVAIAAATTPPATGCVVTAAHGLGQAESLPQQQASS